MELFLFVLVVTVSQLNSCRGQDFCLPFACGSPGVISYRGENNGYSLTSALSTRYTKNCRYTTFKGTGVSDSDDAAIAICGGDVSTTKADIGSMSRDFTSMEATPIPNKPGYFKCLIGTQREVIQLPIAIESIVLFIEKGGQVHTQCIQKIGTIGLTEKEIQWMFSNSLTLENNKLYIKNNDGNPNTKLWSELNPSCPPIPIKIAGPRINSDSYNYFKERILTEGSSEGFRSDYVEFPDNNETLRDYVLNNDYSVGFGTFKYYDYNDATLYGIAINGIMPSITSIEDGTYSFARYIYSVFWNDGGSSKLKCFSQFPFTWIGNIRVQMSWLLPVPERQVSNLLELLPGECNQSGCTTAPSPRPTRIIDCRCNRFLYWLGICCRNK
jgi:ABC-type phosphate transport system substrate-binding protein